MHLPADQRKDLPVCDLPTQAAPERNVMTNKSHLTEQAGQGKPVMVTIIDGREGLLLSWGRDLVSFGGLIATAWVLNTQMQPSGWLNASLAVCWFLWLAGKGAARSTKMTLEQAQAHLSALHDASQS